MPFLRKRTVGREPKKIPLSLFILERVLNQVVKLGVLSYVLAWLLARTSTQAVVNLPLAVCVVIFARWLSLRLVVDTSETGSGSSRRRDRYVVLPSLYRESSTRSSDKSDRDSWKRIVNAPIVASAWESFCGSILQEWVYDSWLSLVTPDREFPAEVRRLLNEIFAEVTQRARRIDLRTVLIRDVCDLFSEQLEIFRATREGVGIRNKGDLKPSSMDRAFQQEMKTEGTLHVAFCTRDGHYRVVRRIAEGVISMVMSRDDLSRPYVKSLVRELFATCVLRPLLMFFTPYNANRLILSAFPEELGSKESELNQHMNTERQNGHFQFEQRVRKSAALEERAVKRAKERMASQKAVQTQTPILKEPFQGQRLRRRHPDVDVASVDDSAMGKELEHSDTGRVLRRLRSKSFDDVRALVGDGRLPGASSLGQGRFVATEGASVASEPLEATIGGSGGGSPTRKWRGASDASEGSPSRSARSPFSCRGAPLYEAPVPDELDFKAGFKGHPRARVGVHEMVYDDGGRKRYVVFKIRVADDTGEWTVARRYRNFEALHKSLRDHPVYQELGLKLPPKRFLLHSQNTEFVEERRTALNGYLQSLLKDKALAFNPDVWAFLCDPNNQTYKHDVTVSLLRTITDNVDTAKHRVKRAVGYRGKQEHQGHHQATDSDLHSSRGSLQTPRDYEAPEGSVSGTSTNGLIGTTPHRFNSVHSDFSNSLRTGDLRRNVGVCGRGSTPSLIGIGNPSSSGAPMSDLQSMHQSWLDGSSVVSRPESPVRSVRNLDAKSTSDTRSVGGSSDTPMKASNAREEIGRESFAWNSLPVMKPEDSWPNWDAEFEDYSGISGPLYEVVDAVFALPGRNMFRKQVLQGVRQLLSLLAGASIDMFLLEKIKSLRTEHTIARIIHSIKNSLWPGGKWFSTVPPYSAAKEKYQKANPGARKGMQRDRYLEPLWGPEDAIDIAERVHHRVFAQAPPTLVTIVGKGLYTSGMQDVYDMLQSPTFVTQIGYGVAEVVLLALFPELRDLFARIHRETAQVHES